MKKLLITAAIFILTSCSYHDQKARLELTTKSVRTNVGNGIGINLKVMDDRIEPNFLGTKEYCNYDKISIINEQNLTDLVARKIEEDLSNKGFSKGDDKVVEVAIKKLQYESECNFFLGKSQAHVLIKVSVNNAKSKTKITKNFELSLKNKHFLIPLISTDINTINELLNEVIQDILDDKILLN